MTVVSYRDTHLQVCLQFPHVWWHFSNLISLAYTTSGLGRCFHAKQTGEEHPDEPGEWPPRSQLLVSHGTSVSPGEGACLDPGGRLSP